MVFETLEWLPRWSESIVGYKFFVSNQEIATSNSDHMFLNWNSGEQFDISCLPSKKRNQVRKGMKLCEIRPLRCLEKYWKDLQRINISNSQRTKSGRSPQYYVKNYVDWKNDIQRLHALENRQWLGAFVNGTLAAYFYGYAVGTTYHINAAKSDTEFLRSNPNDALLFTLLDHALNTEECTQIEYGGYTPTDPSLSKFKEQYGFSKKNVLDASKCSPAVRCYDEANTKFSQAPKSRPSPWMTTLMRHTPELIGFVE